MLAILFLAAVASATPVPKVLPIYEDPVQIQLKHQLPQAQLQRSWCAGECFRHVVDSPVFVVSQFGEGYDIQFSDTGLIGFAKNAQNAGFMKKLNDEQMVAIVTPITSFPFDFFPGLVDAAFKISNYEGKVRDLKEPSMMFIFTESQFKNFNEKKGFTKVADLGINQDTFSLIKEYTHSARSLPVVVTGVNPSSGYFRVAPVPVVPSQNYYAFSNPSAIYSTPLVFQYDHVTY
ncbi:hypothetical protein J6590_023753 [Homalodisca vitripennis]|nr:hypothetical protein J6590_023753 [Homalodisca vitripennis]